MTEPIRITFFGDSTCVGQGVSIYRGWVTQIARQLETLGEVHKREIVVSNSSVNGRTTRQALEDMPYHVQSQDVDILLVQFGLNDCNYWQTDGGVPRVSKAAFIANIEEIIDRARNSGVRKIILNNNHSTSRTSKMMTGQSFSYEDSNVEYNAALREKSQGFGSDIIFMDIESHFRKKLDGGVYLDDCLLSDGLHLSKLGHQIYFDIMSPVIAREVMTLLDA